MSQYRYEYYNCNANVNPTINVKTILLNNTSNSNIPLLIYSLELPCMSLTGTICKKKKRKEKCRTRRDVFPKLCACVIIKVAKTTRVYRVNI